MFLLEPLCIRGCNQTLKHLRGFFCFWLIYWKIRHSHTSNHRQNVRLMMRQAVNSLVCTNYLFADGNLNICRSNWMALEHYQTYSLSCSEMYITNNAFGASLVAQWLRICLPMQGTRVWALVWEDPTCCETTRPVSHNYWACASGACAPQQERPRWWETRAPRWRVAPARRN